MFQRMIPLALVMMAGCQSMPAQPGFDQVQSQVDGRIGHRVAWRTGSEEDRKADEAMRKLLNSELTSASAQQIALLNNRMLQAGYEDLGVSQAAVVQAGLLKNPMLDFTAMIPTAGGSAMLDIGIAQDFLDIFYIPLRTRIASAKYEAVKLDVTGKVLDIAHATHLAFLQVQADLQTIEQRKQNLEAASASFDFAKKLHKAGNLRNVDLASEEAALAQNKLDLATAQSMLEENREKLTNLMGLWGDDTQWRIASQLPVLPDGFDDLANLEKRAINQSLDLAAIRHRMMALADELGIEKSTSLIQGLELGVSSERDDGEWKVGPMLNVPIPIFDQGQARVATAVSQFRREQQLFYAKAVAIRSAARTARLRLVTAQETAIYYRDVILPLREKIVKETLLQYNAMQVSVFQLLTARTQHIEANRRHIEAVHDYWRTKAQLDLLLAGRMSEGDAITMPESGAPDGKSGGH